MCRTCDIFTIPNTGCSSTWDLKKINYPRLLLQTWRLDLVHCNHKHFYWKLSSFSNFSQPATSSILDLPDFWNSNHPFLRDNKTQARLVEVRLVAENFLVRSREGRRAGGIVRRSADWACLWDIMEIVFCVIIIISSHHHHTPHHITSNHWKSEKGELLTYGQLQIKRC